MGWKAVGLDAGSLHPKLHTDICAESSESLCNGAAGRPPICWAGRTPVLLGSRRAAGAPGLLQQPCQTLLRWAPRNLICWSWRGSWQPPFCSCCHPHRARKAPEGARGDYAQALYVQPDNECYPQGPWRCPKRKTNSSEDSLGNKRPALHQWPWRMLHGVAKPGLYHQLMHAPALKDS